jgi:hypothetical protein
MTVQTLAFVRPPQLQLDFSHSTFVATGVGPPLMRCWGCNSLPLACRKFLTRSLKFLWVHLAPQDVKRIQLLSTKRSGRFLSLLYCTVTDRIAVCHPVTLVDIFHVSIVVSVMVGFKTLLCWHSVSRWEIFSCHCLYSMFVAAWHAVRLFDLEENATWFI